MIKFKRSAGWVLGCAAVAGLASAAGAADVSMTLNPIFQAEQVISGTPTSGGTFEVRVGRTSSGAESRGVYEYILPALPGGYALASASFDTGISGAQVGSGAYPDLSLHGYSGNGVYTSADGLIPFNHIGRTGPITSTGRRSDALSTSYIAGRINAGSSHLGLMVYNETLDRYAGISRGNLGEPVVKLNATVPDVGAVNARPIFDVKASSSNNTNYTLTDGEFGINTQYLPAANVDRRGIVEYHLGGVPDGADITSAKIAFDVNSFTSSSTDGGPEVRLYGYSGNGTPDLSDVNQTFTLLGIGNTVESTGPYEVTLSASVIETLLASGNDYIGVLALGSADGQQFGFSTIENGSPAILSVGYAVPEPGSVALLLAPLAMLARRRRGGGAQG